MTKSIVLEVCREYRVHPAEFFDPRRRRRNLVKVRLIAIGRLHRAGFCMMGIARMMRRNYSTIRYWMRPAVRSYKRREAVAYWEKKRTAA